MTICQVRRAANALLDALTLNAEDQKLRLAKVARIIREDQKDKAAARASHTQARVKTLRAKGIYLSKLRCCIPP